MKTILALALFVVGCGDVEPTMPVARATPVIDAVGDPMACTLDADKVACHCVIPEYSLDAIAAMGNRCNFLRSLELY